MVLGLSPDPFAVLPGELVRKAVDEVAQGLQLYVLYTMIHSSALKVPCPVMYSVVNAYEWDFDRNSMPFASRVASRKFQVDVSTMTKFIDTVTPYINSSLSRDFRSLMKHVKCVNKRELQAKYYTHDSIDVATAMRYCAGFFYHRNSLVSPLDTQPRDYFNYDAVASREAKVADYFFGFDFGDTLPMPTNWAKFVWVPGWIRSDCEMLRDAAFGHFKTAKMIRDVYKHMFGLRNISNAINSSSTLVQVELISSLNWRP